MDKAKAAVSDFLHRSGHNDTTVEERVAPAVVNENVTEIHKTEKQKILDKEIHQDHYHTTVQPVTDREVLPEEHSHRMGAVETRELRHGNDAEIKARIEREAAQFQSSRTEGEVRESTSKLPTVVGEHVHHHVHETIQPVVQKEIIQPSVVHTTIPIHEVHTHAAQHHAASALPAVSMADFKKQGGVLGGREVREDQFEGEPKGIKSVLGTSSTRDGVSDMDDSRNTGLTGTRGTGMGSETGMTGSHTTAGPHRSDLLNKADPTVDSDMDGSRNMGMTGNRGTGTGMTGSNQTSGTGMDSGYTGTGMTGSNQTTGTGVGSGYTDTGVTGSNQTSGPHRSNLANKADPRVDSDMDGSRNMGMSENSGYGNDSTTTSTTKPSLLDRLNPMKDTSSTSRNV